MSRLIAGRLTREAADEAAFIRAGYDSVLGRPPSAQELAACREFLTEQKALLADGKKLTASSGAAASPVPPAADPAQRARENLMHVLMNHNDFVMIR